MRVPARKREKRKKGKGRGEKRNCFCHKLPGSQSWGWSHLQSSELKSFTACTGGKKQDAKRRQEKRGGWGGRSLLRMERWVGDVALPGLDYLK